MAFVHLTTAETYTGATPADSATLQFPCTSGKTYAIIANIHEANDKGNVGISAPSGSTIFGNIVTNQNRSSVVSNIFQTRQLDNAMQPLSSVYGSIIGTVIAGDTGTIALRFSANTSADTAVISVGSWLEYVEL